MYKALSILCLVVLIAGIVFLAKSRPTNYSTANVKIVGSFYPMSFFAQKIVGEKAEVYTITPAGAEPHDYELSAQDVATIENASLVVLNGGGLESWSDKIKQNLRGSATQVVVAGNGLINQNLVEDGRTSQDPHIWLNPVTAEAEVHVIASAIEQSDPLNTRTYQTNANTLENNLKMIDAEYQSGLASCRTRTFITSHAAFGYLANQYHLTQKAISGLSPDSEPSAQQMTDIAQYVRDNNLHTIFFESLVSPKLSQSIAQETGASTLELNPLEGLTKEEAQNGNDYFSVMRQNLTNLQTALQCQK